MPPQKARLGKDGTNGQKVRPHGDRRMAEMQEMYGFDVQPTNRKGIDILGVGAVGVRLSSEEVPLHEATVLRVYQPTGAELNPITNAASTFGLRGAFCTALVENHPLGDMISAGLRRVGVEGIYARFQDNGLGDPCHAIVLSDQGEGIRNPEVFYLRATEAGRLLDPGHFEWRNIFNRGVRWAHSGGLFAALSAHSTWQTILTLAKTAGAYGAPFSFDINERPKLWARYGPDHAREVYSFIIPYATCLFGNEGDLQAIGIKGPDLRKESALDPERYKTMILETIARFPNLRIVATTLRETVSTREHNWSAIAWINGQFHQAPTINIPVLDRVGGGDGFAGGLISAILMGREPKEAVLYGWALGAHVACSHGDTSQVKARHVEKLVRSALKGEVGYTRIDR